MDLKIGDRVKVNRDGFADHGRTATILREIPGMVEVAFDEPITIDPETGAEIKDTYYYQPKRLIKLEPDNDNSASGGAI